MLGTKLGSGVHGDVYALSDSQAVKKVNIIDEPTKLGWIIESSLLRNFCGIIPVPVFNNASIDRKGKFNLVMRRYTCLKDFDSNTISPELRGAITRDVALALETLHHCGIIHRDIKKSNILLDIKNGKFISARLSDFSLAIAESYQKLMCNIVKIEVDTSNDIICEEEPTINIPCDEAYPICARPPEVYESMYINTKSDVWGYGCLCMSMCGYINGINYQKLESKTQKSITHIINKYTSQDESINSICHGALQIDSALRPSLCSLLGFSIDYKTIEIENDASKIIQEIYKNLNDKGMRPLEILEYVIGSTIRRKLGNLFDLLEKWDYISEHFVMMSIHLILRLATIMSSDINRHAKHISDFCIYIVICINIAAQLFHPSNDLPLAKLFTKACISPSEYNHHSFVLYNLFNFNVLSNFSLQSPTREL
jgi:serine/threonine protein kinase